MPFKETAQYKLDYAEGPTKVSEYPTVDAQKSKAIDELMNEPAQDILQAGVVNTTSWEFTAKTIEGTGELESSGEVPESLAWLANPTYSGKLVRSKNAKAAIAPKKPSSLPAEGKFMPIAFELTGTTQNGAATVSLHSGTERATLAEAEASPPAAEAGKTQIRMVYLKLTGPAKYKIEGQKDVRPWATGSTATNSSKPPVFLAPSGKYTAGSVFTSGQAEAGQEVSATRAAVITLETNEVGTAKLFVGGVEVHPALKINTPVTYFIGPGEVWKANLGMTIRYRLL